jgi:hypothetical protein
MCEVHSIQFSVCIIRDGNVPSKSSASRIEALA